MALDPAFLIVDLFCGAGGTSTGFARAKVGRRNIAKVIAAINHDPAAIQSHWSNHPSVKHFEEDIRTLNLDKLIQLVCHYRKLFPNSRLILWASLECTNFSKAKGGMARDADSRTLADHLHRYVSALNPDYIQIENVVEFMDWGPMRIKAKTVHEDRTDLHITKNVKKGTWAYGWVPVKETKGQDFKRWCTDMCSHGYEMDWKRLNSADYGAYTSRDRLFGVFAKPEFNIVWPPATHSKKIKKGRRKWMACKECLDFSDEGYTIFDRSGNVNIPKRQRKDLVAATFERIYAGLIKQVAGGKDAFLSRYNGGKPESRNTSLDEPCTVITTENRHSLIQPNFIVKYFSGKPEGKNISTNGPARTIKTIDGQALIQAQFMVQRNTGNPEGRIVSVDQPARTLTSTAGNQDLVSPNFLAQYYGNGDNITSVEQPAPTLTTKDRCALVQPCYILNYNHSSCSNSVDDPAPTLVTKDKLAFVTPAFIDKQYGGVANHQSLEGPARTITNNPKHSLVQIVNFIDRPFSGGGQNSSIDLPIGALCNVPKVNLVKCEPFVMSTNFTNPPSSIYDPLGSITANRKWHYLVNLSWGGHLYPTSSPSPVIIAGQDKAPLYLFVTE